MDPIEHPEGGFIASAVPLGSGAWTAAALRVDASKLLGPEEASPSSGDLLPQALRLIKPPRALQRKLQSILSQRRGSASAGAPPAFAPRRRGEVTTERGDEDILLSMIEAIVTTETALVSVDDTESSAEAVADHDEEDAAEDFHDTVDSAGTDVASRLGMVKALVTSAWGVSEGKSTPGALFPSWSPPPAVERSLDTHHWRADSYGAIVSGSLASVLDACGRFSFATLRGDNPCSVVFTFPRPLDTLLLPPLSVTLHLSRPAPPGLEVRAFLLQNRSQRLAQARWVGTTRVPHRGHEALDKLIVNFHRSPRPDEASAESGEVGILLLQVGVGDSCLPPGAFGAEDDMEVLAFEVRPWKLSFWSIDCTVLDSGLSHKAERVSVSQSVSRARKGLDSSPDPAGGMLPPVSNAFQRAPLRTVLQLVADWLACVSAGTDTIVKLDASSLGLATPAVEASLIDPAPGPTQAQRAEALALLARLAMVSGSSVVVLRTVQTLLRCHAPSRPHNAPDDSDQVPPLKKELIPQDALNELFTAIVQSPGRTVVFDSCLHAAFMLLTELAASSIRFAASGGQETAGLTESPLCFECCVETFESASTLIVDAMNLGLTDRRVEKLAIAAVETVRGALLCARACGIDPTVFTEPVRGQGVTPLGLLSPRARILALADAAGDRAVAARALGVDMQAIEFAMSLRIPTRVVLMLCGVMFCGWGIGARGTTLEHDDIVVAARNILHLPDKETPPKPLVNVAAQTLSGCAEDLMRIAASAVSAGAFVLIRELSSPSARSELATSLDVANTAVSALLKAVASAADADGESVFLDIPSFVTSAGAFAVSDERQELRAQLLVLARSLAAVSPLWHSEGPVLPAESADAASSLLESISTNRAANPRDVAVTVLHGAESVRSVLTGMLEQFTKRMLSRTLLDATAVGADGNQDPAVARASFVAFLDTARVLLALFAGAVRATVARARGPLSPDQAKAVVDALCHTGAGSCTFDALSVAARLWRVPLVAEALLPRLLLALQQVAALRAVLPSADSRWMKEGERWIAQFERVGHWAAVRLSCVLVSGPLQGQKERDLSPWIRAPPFSQGIAPTGMAHSRTRVTTLHPSVAARAIDRAGGVFSMDLGLKAIAPQVRLLKGWKPFRSVMDPAAAAPEPHGAPGGARDPSSSENGTLLARRYLGEATNLEWRQDWLDSGLFHPTSDLAAAPSLTEAAPGKGILTSPSMGSEGKDEDDEDDVAAVAAAARSSAFAADDVGGMEAAVPLSAEECVRLAGGKVGEWIRNAYGLTKPQKRSRWRNKATDKLVIAVLLRHGGVWLKKDLEAIQSGKISTKATGKSSCSAAMWTVVLALDNVQSTLRKLRDTDRSDAAESLRARAHFALSLRPALCIPDPDSPSAMEQSVASLRAALDASMRLCRPDGETPSAAAAAPLSSLASMPVDERSTWTPDVPPSFRASAPSSSWHATLRRALVNQIDPASRALSRALDPKSSAGKTACHLTAIVCGCVEEYLLTGAAAMPEMLRGVFRVRAVRATQRAMGLAAIDTVFRTILCPVPASTEAADVAAGRTPRMGMPASKHAAEALRDGIALLTPAFHGAFSYAWSSLGALRPDPASTARDDGDAVDRRQQEGDDVMSDTGSVGPGGAGPEGRAELDAVAESLMGGSSVSLVSSLSLPTTVAGQSKPRKALAPLFSDLDSDAGSTSRGSIRARVAMIRKMRGHRPGTSSLSREEAPIVSVAPTTEADVQAQAKRHDWWMGSFNASFVELSTSLSVFSPSILDPMTSSVHPMAHLSGSPLVLQCLCRGAFASLMKGMTECVQNAAAMEPFLLSSASSPRPPAHKTDGRAALLTERDRWYSARWSRVLVRQIASAALSVWVYDARPEDGGLALATGLWRTLVSLSGLHSDIRDAVSLEARWEGMVRGFERRYVPRGDAGALWPLWRIRSGLLDGTLPKRRAVVLLAEAAPHLMPGNDAAVQAWFFANSLVAPLRHVLSRTSVSELVTMAGDLWERSRDLALSRTRALMADKVGATDPDWSSDPDDGDREVDKATGGIAPVTVPGPRMLATATARYGDIAETMLLSRQAESVLQLLVVRGLVGVAGDGATDMIGASPNAAAGETHLDDARAFPQENAAGDAGAIGGVGEAALREPKPQQLHLARWALRAMRSLSGSLCLRLAAADTLSQELLHTTALLLAPGEAGAAAAGATPSEEDAGPTHQSPPSSSPLAGVVAGAGLLEPLELEHRAYHLLRLMAVCGKSPVGAAILGTPQNVATLVQWLPLPRSGSAWDAGGDVAWHSPRCRALATQSLGWIAGTMPPTRVDSALLSATAVMGMPTGERWDNSRSVGDFRVPRGSLMACRLLEASGASMCAGHDPVAGTAAGPVCDIGPGQSQQEFAAVAVSALSELALATPAWRRAVWTAVSASLDHASPVVRAIVESIPNPEDPPPLSGKAVLEVMTSLSVEPIDLFRAVAATALVGGSQEMLRVGSRVRVQAGRAGDGGSEGVVVGMGESLYSHAMAAEALSNPGRRGTVGEMTLLDDPEPVRGRDVEALGLMGPGAGCATVVLFEEVATAKGSNVGDAAVAALQIGRGQGAHAPTEVTVAKLSQLTPLPALAVAPIRVIEQRLGAATALEAALEGDALAGLSAGPAMATVVVGTPLSRMFSMPQSSSGESDATEADPLSAFDDADEPVTTRPGSSSSAWEGGWETFNMDSAGAWDSSEAVFSDTEADSSSLATTIVRAIAPTLRLPVMDLVSGPDGFGNPKALRAISWLATLQHFTLKTVPHLLANTQAAPVLVECVMREASGEEEEYPVLRPLVQLALRPVKFSSLFSAEDLLFRRQTIHRWLLEMEQEGGGLLTAPASLAPAGLADEPHETIASAVRSVQAIGAAAGRESNRLAVAIAVASLYGKRVDEVARSSELAEARAGSSGLSLSPEMAADSKGEHRAEVSAGGITARERLAGQAANLATALGQPERVCLAALEMMGGEAEAAEWLLGGQATPFVVASKVRDLEQNDKPTTGSWVREAENGDGTFVAGVSKNDPTGRLKLATKSAGAGQFLAVHAQALVADSLTRSSRRLGAAAEEEGGPSAASAASARGLSTRSSVRRIEASGSISNLLGMSTVMGDDGAIQRHSSQVFTSAAESTGGDEYRRVAASGIFIEDRTIPDRWNPITAAQYGDAPLRTGLWSGAAASLASGQGIVSPDAAPFGVILGGMSEPAGPRESRVLLDMAFWSPDTGSRIVIKVAMMRPVLDLTGRAHRRLGQRVVLPVSGPSVIAGSPLLTRTAGVAALAILDDALAVLESRRALAAIMRAYQAAAPPGMSRKLPLSSQDTLRLFRLINASTTAIASPNPASPTPAAVAASAAGSSLSLTDVRGQSPAAAGGADPSDGSYTATLNELGRTLTVALRDQLLSPAGKPRESAAAASAASSHVGSAIAKGKSLAGSMIAQFGASLRSAASTLSPHLERVVGSIAAKPDESAVSHTELARGLVDEIARNLRGGKASEIEDADDDSTERDSAAATVLQSLHGMPVNVAYSTECRFPEASGMVLHFDSRTSVPRSASVVITQLQGAVAMTLKSLRGSAAANESDFGPLAIAGDSIRVDTSYFPPEGAVGSFGVDEGHFGWRIRATPMKRRSWSSEASAAAGSESFEFGSFLWSFVTGAVPELAASGALHSTPVVKALLRHLATPGRPFKDRAISMLAQLLATPELLEPGPRGPSGALLEMGNELMSVVTADLERRKASAEESEFPAELLRLLQLAVLAQRGGGIAAGDSVDLLTLSPASATLASGRHELASMASWPPSGLDKQLKWLMGLSSAVRHRWPIPPKVMVSVFLYAHNKPFLTTKAPASAGLQLCESQKAMTQWSRAQDQQLARWLTRVAKKRDVGQFDLDAKALQDALSDRSLMDEFPLLSAHASRKVAGKVGFSVVLRGCLVLLMNKLLAVAIPYIELDAVNTAADDEDDDIADTEGSGEAMPMDASATPEEEVHARALSALGRSGREWTLGAHLRALAHLCLPACKMPLLNDALKASESPESARHTEWVWLHQGKALQNREHGRVRPNVSECMLAQMAPPLVSLKDHELRVALDRHGRLFRVAFRTFDSRGQTVDEAGIDAGGLFRDAISTCIQDAFDPSTLSLFLEAPSPSEELGGKGVFIPNPAETSRQALTQYEAMGILIGLAVRTGKPQAFKFSSYTWKRLLGRRPTVHDVRVFDKRFADIVARLQLTAESSSDDPYEVIPSLVGQVPLSVRRSDGVSIALPQPASARHPSAAAGAAPGCVTACRAAILEHCSNAIEARAAEHERAFEAMRRGLGRVIPLSAIRLLTWREFEILACGENEIDVERMQRHSKYIGDFSATHPAVRVFWAAVESFSQSERVMLVQFAWGRSRLPPPGEWKDSEPFKVGPIANTSRRARRGKELPIAHTCFAQIELPEYDSVAQCREKLLIALHGSVGAITLA
jgi:hypothetical protein